MTKYTSISIRVQRVIDSGLSFGEESDEDETAPEGFEEEEKELGELFHD